MSLEVILLPKTFSTYGACVRPVRLIIRVRVSVLLFSSSRRGGINILILYGGRLLLLLRLRLRGSLLPRVHSLLVGTPHVLPQLVLSGARPLAHVARVRLFVVVHGAHVAVELVLRVTRVRAQLTLVRTNTFMHRVDVLLQMSFLPEPFPTYRAAMRPLLGRRLLVLVVCTSHGRSLI